MNNQEVQIIKKKKKWYEYLRIPSPWDYIIIFILNVLLTVPIFIIVHQNIIDPEWPYHLDRILLCIVILAVFQFILYKLKSILFICILAYLGIFFIGTSHEDYDLESIFDDYRVMIYAMASTQNPQDLIISKLLPFPNKSKVIKAIEYDNPKVRNFALLATTKNFSKVQGYGEYRQIIQCLAIFKEVRTRWNYVNDPKGREYIATASESLIHFSGDCDDYSILMAALVRSIGGTPRLIHTKEHMYPEMLIENKAHLEKVIFLIKEVLFVEESKGKEVHYHVDERGQIWLNLDYTARYPGGPFMSEEILGQLTLN
ncbi:MULTISPECIES: transglutaminase domain-containing protein [Myroides]|uniref:transglutaminase domain-containing protein n=1 Tax=Myroides odoratus TaxID=256 RepID=UPI000765D9AA|nr:MULTISPECIES: transglutaminase domain-containing protein [Myroides]WHT39808.1 transglutaminase domain-containing protein [Myroides sp. mNGS23_01]